MPVDNNQDLPLEINSQEDLPLDLDVTLKKPEPESMQDMRRGHAAALESDIDGINIVEAFKNIDPSADPKDLVNLLSYKRTDKQREVLKNYFNANLGNTPSEIAQNALVYQKMVDQQEANRSDVEKQVTESLSGIEVDENMKQQIQAELLLANTVSEMVNDYQFFDKAVDFGKMLLPTTASFDNYQLTGSVFGAQDYLRDVITGLKDLKETDPVKFQKVFPAFVNEIKDVLPKGKAISVIAAVGELRGEEKAGEQFRAIDAVLDVADAATLGMAAAVKVGKLVSKLNAIKTASRLGNVEVAAELNVATLTDETGEIARTAGVDKTTAYSNAAPFRVDELDESYAAGLSTESLQRIQSNKAKQRKVTEIVTSDNGILREELLSQVERDTAENKFVDNLRTRGFEDITVAGRGRDSTEFRYAYVGEDGKKQFVREKMNLTYDDITRSWRDSEQGMFAAWLKSPTAFAKNAIEDVRSAIRLDTTSPVVGNMLKELQTDALTPLIGKRGFGGLRPKVRRQLAEIDNVLLAGDSYKDAAGIQGKVFSVEELRGGVNGVKLNDSQIEVYYNLRNLYDELWVIRNSETRRNLLAQGKRQVMIDEAPHVGNSYDKAGGVGVINSSGNVRVYDAAAREARIIDGSEMAALYDDGYVLNKLDNTISHPDIPDELYDLVITHRGSVGQLPNKVIHFREGYVPKVNRDAYWFVKQRGTRTVNGKVHTNQVLKTERMFSNKHEAEAWLRTQGRDDLVLLPDRALEKQLLGDSQVGSGGGLYTGPRAVEDIPFGAEGLPGERLSTLEALSLNIHSLQNFVSRNQWRMSMRQKWINSARQAGFDFIEKEGYKPGLIPADDPRGVGLKKLAEQIDIWSGFPTKGELWWDGVVSSGMEWALNHSLLPKKVVLETGNYLRRTGDPVTKLRGLAFHSLLGWFNPAQLWVQAQGATVAASLAFKLKDPIAPLRLLKNQTALAFASRFADDPAVLKRISSVAQIPAKELDEIVRLWKRTGYEDSVLNTADHAAAIAGYGSGADALRRVADKGLLFYRTGELVNRRYTFLTALERARERLGRINLTDAELRNVMTDANNMMLNLSKANRASWQRGVVALPTQFLQVQAKMVETLVGANQSFTVGERLKIMAGQIAFYGAAGIPMGALGVRWVTEQLGVSQGEIENLPPEVVKLVNGGLWEYFIFAGMGADVDVASRGAIADGITEFTTDLIFSEAPITEKILGAFGTVPHRFYKAYKVIEPMALGAMFHEEKLTNEQILQAVSSLASVTSTWNNIQKGLFMNRLHMLIDSRGRVVVSGDDFKTETEVMTMLGFQPSELQRVRDRDALVRGRKEYRSQVVDSMVNNYWLYVQTYKGADNDAEREQVIKNFKIANTLIAQSLRNEDEVRKVQEAFKDRVEKGEDEKTRSIRQFIEEFNDSQVVGAGTIIQSMLANGMIQNDLQVEE